MENIEKIDELSRALDKLSEKYGRLATANREYHSIQEGLGIAKEIGDIDQQGVAIEKLSTRIKSLGTEAEKSSRSASESLTGLFNSIKFGVTGIALDGLVGTFHSAWENIQKINHSFTELKKVYEPSDNNGYDVNNFMGVANKMGSQLGYNTADTLDAIYQAINYGYSNKEVAENIARASLILSNSGQIPEADASKYMISILRAFKVDDPNKMVTVNGGQQETAVKSIIDQLSFGGMNFPITSGGIGEALQRGGSALATAGNTLEQSIQMIIAGNMSRQDPATVGNSMKSIAGSFTDILLGDTKSDILNRKNLQQILPNFKWFDDKGNLRSTYDILSDISKLYKDGKISPNNLQWLSSIIGGKTQLGVVNSLIQHLGDVSDKYKDLSNQGIGVYGSADRENEKYLDSFAGRITTLKDSVDKLWTDILNTGDVNKVLGAGNKVVEIIDKIISKIGVLRTVAMGIGAFALFKNRNSFDNLGKATLNTIKSIINGVRSLRNLPPLELEKIKKDPNDDIKGLLNKSKTALEEGVKTGETYADGIAEGIRSNTSVDEAIESKLDKYNKLSEKIKGEEESLAREEEESLAKKEENTLESGNYDYIPREVREENEEQRKAREMMENYESEKRLQSSKIELPQVENVGGITSGLKEVVLEEEQVGEAGLKMESAYGEATESMLLKTEEMANGIEANVEKMKTSMTEAEALNFNGIEEHSKGGTKEVGKVAEEGEHLVEKEESSVAKNVIGDIGGVIGMGLDGLVGTATAGAGIIAIPLIMEGVEKLITANERLAESNKKTYEQATEGSKKYGDEVKALSEFQDSDDGKRLESLNQKLQAGQLNEKETQEYYDLLKKVAQISPESVAFTDSKGNPYINMKDGINGVIKALKEMQQQEKASLLTSKKVNDFWKQINDDQKKSTDEMRVFNASHDEGTLNHVEDEIDLNKNLHGSQLTSAIQKEESQFNEAQQKLEEIKSKWKQEQQDMINDIVNPHIEASVNTSGLSDEVKQQYEHFLDGLNLSQLTQSQMQDIFSKLDTEMATDGGQKLISDLSKTVDGLKEQYANGEISFSQFSDKMGEVKNKLIKEAGLTPEEANALTNTDIWKKAENSQQAYAEALGKTADSVGLSGQKLQSAFQEQYGMFNNFLNEMNDTSTLGKQKLQENLENMFTLNPEAGKSLAQSLGISMNSDLKQVADTIANNPSLKEEFSNAMGYLIAGEPVPPEVQQKLASDINDAINGATNQINGGNGKTIDIKTKVIPDGNASSVGQLDGLDYKKGVQLTGLAGGKVLTCEEASGIGSGDGLKYASGVKENAQGEGKVLGDDNANGTGNKDGLDYKQGVSSTGLGKGKILGDGNANGIGSKDGLSYKSGATANALGKGKILNDTSAGATGQKDGFSWKNALQSVAKAMGIVNTTPTASASGNKDGFSWKNALKVVAKGNGTVNPSGNAYSVGAKDGFSWKSGFLSVASGIASTIGGIVSNAYHSAKSALGISAIAITPHAKITLAPIKAQLTEAHNNLKSFSTGLFSSKLVSTSGFSGFSKPSSGGVSGGKGGKGGKGGVSGGGTPSLFTSLASKSTDGTT